MVWQHIIADKAEATNMRLRSYIMIQISEYITKSNKSQNKLSVDFGINRSIISDIMCGRINRFSIDRLVNIATLFGLQVDMMIIKLYNRTAFHLCRHDE